MWIKVRRIFKQIFNYFNFNNTLDELYLIQHTIVLDKKSNCIKVVNHSITKMFIFYISSFLEIFHLSFNNLYVKIDTILKICCKRNFYPFVMLLRKIITTILVKRKFGFENFCIFKPVFLLIFLRNIFSKQISYG